MCLAGVYGCSLVWFVVFVWCGVVLMPSLFMLRGGVFVFCAGWLGAIVLGGFGCCLIRLLFLSVALLCCLVLLIVLFIMLGHVWFLLLF